MGSPRSRRSSQHRFRRRRMPQEGMLVRSQPPPGWRSGGPKLVPPGRAMPPASWPKQSFTPGRTLWASGPVEGHVRQWGSPWPSTATATRLSNCPSGAGACRVHPVRRCGSWASGRSTPSPPRPREGWSGWGQPSRTGHRIAPGRCCVTIQEATDVLQQFLPRFNAQLAVAAEQPEKAYRPISAELSRPRPSASNTLARWDRQHGQIPLAGPATASRDGPA